MPFARRYQHQLRQVLAHVYCCCGQQSAQYSSDVRKCGAFVICSWFWPGRKRHRDGLKAQSTDGNRSAFGRTCGQHPHPGQSGSAQGIRHHSLQALGTLQLLRPLKESRLRIEVRVLRHYEVRSEKECQSGSPIKMNATQLASAAHRRKS